MPRKKNPKPTRCAWCSGPLEQPRTGRPRKTHPGRCRSAYKSRNDLRRRRHRVAAMLTPPDAIGARSVADLDLARDGRPLADQLADLGLHVEDFLADPEIFLREVRRWRKIEAEARKAREAALRAYVAALSDDEREVLVDRGRARWLRWRADNV